MIAYTESCPVRQGVFNGGIAQLARACGSYPQCPRFKSRCRYQTPKDGTAPSFGTSLQEYPAPLGQPGPLVKWLRHRPFTAVTRVRVPYGSPIWRLSSAGRALASHARGHRFEFCSLHHSRANPCDLHGFFSFLRTLWSGLLLPFFSDQTVTHTGVWSGTDRAENRDIDGPQPKNICTITEKSVI